MNWSTYSTLIIDDEPDNIRAAEYILRYHHVTVYSERSGQEGFDFLRTTRISFVLLDIQMPKMSGWDVLKLIRADSTLADIPVIALTAHAMPHDMEQALQAGFDGYITKPISPRTFMEQIADWLEHAQASQRLLIPQEKLP